MSNNQNFEDYQSYKNNLLSTISSFLNGGLDNGEMEKEIVNNTEKMNLVKGKKYGWFNMKMHFSTTVRKYTIQKNIFHINISLYSIFEKAETFGEVADFCKENKISMVVSNGRVFAHINENGEIITDKNRGIKNKIVNIIQMKKEDIKKLNVFEEEYFNMITENPSWTNSFEGSRATNRI